MEKWFSYNPGGKFWTIALKSRLSLSNKIENMFIFQPSDFMWWRGKGESSESLVSLHYLCSLKDLDRLHEFQILSNSFPHHAEKGDGARAGGLRK